MDFVVTKNGIVKKKDLGSKTRQWRKTRSGPDSRGTPRREGTDNQRLSISKDLKIEYEFGSRGALLSAFLRAYGSAGQRVGVSPRELQPWRTAIRTCDLIFAWSVASVTSSQQIRQLVGEPGFFLILSALRPDYPWLVVLFRAYNLVKLHGWHVDKLRGGGVRLQ